MKTVSKLLVALVALVLVAVLAGPFLLARLVTAAVREGGEYALGTPTEVDSADVDLDGVTLGGLRVDNVSGFDYPVFLAVRRTRLEVDLASLRSDTVVAPLLELEGLDLYLEREEGETNYGRILAHLRELGGDGSEEPDPGAKEFRIERVELRDVTAHLDFVPVGGELTKVEVVVPEVTLSGVGSADGVSVAELVAVIVEATLQATLKAGGGSIPPELLADLQGQVRELGEALGEKARSTVEELERKARKVLDDIGDVLEQDGG